ncbi:MAG: type I glyceraldehyde-3-phosphate dehydrogenase [Myxococcales bacterium]|nr:type I glyceraldehyde-3-phosphate dehydrogenase [Myxococcales bacterium]
MAVPKIAVNGFGRIGRTIVRLAKLRGVFNIVAVNDLSSPESLQYSFQYDSIHGIYPGSVGLDGDVMTVDGDSFRILAERDPAKLPWKELGVDYVVEATGQFRKIAQLEAHLEAGARRVLLTVPCKDPLESTVVLGVNDHVVKPESRIISNASCTTNCAAPVAKVLHESFGLKRGLLNTIHAYTSDQRLIDAPHSKDMRRSRNAATNIVPTSTGAAKAIGQVIPELAGRLDGLAMRVPVADGSAIDLTVELGSDVTVQEINEAMRKAAAGPLDGILQYSEAPIVSSDIVGNAYSSIFDAPLTQVIDGSFVKVIAWYDNEWGYSSRVADLVERVASMDGLSG